MLLICHCNDLYELLSTVLSWHLQRDRWASTDHPYSRTGTWSCRGLSWVYLLLRWSSSRGTTTPSKGKPTPLGEEVWIKQVNVSFINWNPTSINNMWFVFFQCPVLIAWGDKDPWEPIEIGRNYRNFDSVEDFIVLPNVGHCPQVLSLSLSRPPPLSLSHMYRALACSIYTCTRVLS